MNYSQPSNANNEVVLNTLEIIPSKDSFQNRKQNQTNQRLPKRIS
jgi:hypothetical protein